MTMMHQGSFLLNLLLLCFSLQRGHTQELKYALFTSGPMGGFDSSGAVPAIEIAEELINLSDSVLPGYNLSHTTVVDTMCDRTTSLDEYFRTIPPPNPTVLGLLGCGCSVASTPVAEIIHHQSLSQIAYGSSTIELNDRRRFPNFFRTYPSDADFTPAIVSVIQYYGWKRIAFITQNEALFTGTLDRLMAPLSQLDIDVRNRLVPSEIPIKSVYNPDVDFFFENDDIRVFFLNSYSDMGRQIICEGFRRGFTYPRYAWLTYGWYEDRWWTMEVNPQLANCSDNDLAGFLNRALAMQIYPIANSSDENTDVGLTPYQFETRYQARLAKPEAKNSNYTRSFVATVAYDALWTLALALNNTDEMIRSSSREEILNRTQCQGSDITSGIVWELVALENFTYSNELMGCVMRWNLERTDFSGVSGRVQLNEVGSRLQSKVQISQYKVGGDITNITVSRVTFGFSQMLNESTSIFIYKPNESNDTVYPASEGGIPPDGTPSIQITTFHLALVVSYYVLATIGLVFCTVCLIFNFTQRKRKVVRLTSPNLNYFIIIGCYIMYSSIFFRIMPSIEYEVHLARCNLDTVCNTVGYCFAFGTILAKMGRIYHIFHNPTTSKKTLKDWHLILVILGITGLGTLIALVQVGVPLLTPMPYLVNTLEYSTGRDAFGVRIDYQAYFCFTSENVIQTAFLFVTFAYLILLQIVGIILAIQTRKVKIKILNDSKYIAALIYISSVVLVFITIVTFVIGNYPNVIEIIFSGGLLVATTAFLCLLFIPKMVSLYRDPDGELIFDNTTNAATSVVEAGLTGLSTLKNGRTISDASNVPQLESRIAELESLLREYQVGQSPQATTVTEKKSLHLSASDESDKHRSESTLPLIEIIIDEDGDSSVEATSQEELRQQNGFGDNGGREPVVNESIINDIVI